MKITPEQPFLLSPVVTLITPSHYPLWIYRSIPSNPIIPNFGELDGRRLARLFCFILNFWFYLRDLSFNSDGVHSLGPFVAAGERIG